MTITEITPLGYRISMKKLRTPLTDFFVDGIESELKKNQEQNGREMNSQEQNGQELNGRELNGQEQNGWEQNGREGEEFRWHIIGCFDDAGATGFAVYFVGENVAHIRFLIADEKSREKYEETEQQLYKYIRGECENRNIRDLYWDSSDAEKYDGFVKINGCNLYGITIDKFKPMWRSFVENGQKLMNRIEKQLEKSGRHLETKGLKELSDSERNTLIELYRKERDSDYLSDLLDGKSRKLIDSMCDVTFVDDRIVAYVFFAETDFNGCMLSYLYSDEDHRGKGYFLIPLMKAVETGFSLGFDRVCWTIDENNTFSSKFMKRHFAGMKIIDTDVEYKCELSKSKRFGSCGSRAGAGDGFKQEGSDAADLCGFGSGGCLQSVQDCSGVLGSE